MPKLLTIADAINLARTAFETNTVAEFLRGGGDYAVPVNRYVSANLPTDFDYILRVCIYGYYKEYGSDKIPLQFLDGLKQLLDGDCVSVWCAYNLIWFQITNEINAVSPFSIINGELLKRLFISLTFYRKELENCKLWQGKYKNKGLWQDIEKAEAVLSSKYGVRLL